MAARTRTRRARAGRTLGNTFVVMHSRERAVPVRVTPTVYRDLDRRFRGFGGRTLVAIHRFTKNWPSWERHPAGDELVCLLSGRATVVLQGRGGRRRVSLRERGAFVIVPRGVWHTALISTATRMLFVTPGKGTENRNA